MSKSKKKLQNHKPIGRVVAMVRLWPYKRNLDKALNAYQSDETSVNELLKVLSGFLKFIDKRYGPISPQGLSRRSNRYRELLDETLEHYYLDNLSEADEFIGNGNCPHQWVIVRLAAMAYLLPVFCKAIRKEQDVFFVTAADPGHECEFDRLQYLNSGNVLQKARRFDQLHKSSPDYLSFTVAEVNGNEEPSGALFAQPHLHMLVTGVSKEEIQSGFEYKRSSEFSGSTRKSPLKVLPVMTMRELVERIVYMTKHKPEQKTVYHDRIGNRNSRRQSLIEGVDEWASWFANSTIRKVVIINGLSEKKSGQFWNAELSEILPLSVRACSDVPQNPFLKSQKRRKRQLEISQI